jgi:hypothetical protein
MLDAARLMQQGGSDRVLLKNAHGSKTMDVKNGTAANMIE